MAKITITTISFEFKIGDNGSGVVTWKYTGSGIINGRKFPSTYYVTIRANTGTTQRPFIGLNTANQANKTNSLRFLKDRLK